MEQITVILTSCGRFDLLEETLESFYMVNTYPIFDFFIYEDKGTKNYTGEDIDAILNLIAKFGDPIWIFPKQRTGQIVALDTLMDNGKTDYYFNLEDNWVFIRDGFIPASLDILEKYEMCNQVQLRGKDFINGQPSVMKDGVLQLEKNYNGRWHGWGFNPSVRRRLDYSIIAPYGMHTTFNPVRPSESEAILSKKYSDRGYFTAVLPEPYIIIS